MTATPPPLPAEPKRKRWTWWKILLLALGIPLGLVMLLFGCGLLYEVTAKDLPVTEADRLVLVTAETLRPYMDDAFAPENGTTSISKRRYLDGSHELEYEFEYESEDEYLYIYCTLNIEKSPTDAKTIYVMSKAGGEIGISLEDVELTSRNDLLRYGDTSECSLMSTEDGAPLGNYFICRMGLRVFVVSLSGVYWDEGDGLKELLRPVLEAASTYRP